MQDRATPTPTHDLPDRVSHAWPLTAWRDTNVAVAVSGGADSVALLRVLAKRRQLADGRGELFVLHYDHATRAASAGDAAWVAELAQRHGLTFRSERSPHRGDRSEENLRTERRDFFVRAAGELGVRYLATGHTADDQAETVLFRVLRGSGIRGLAGIRPTARLTDDCALVRPLLAESRGALRGYLESIGQTWREDASNTDVQYTRNWLRNEALPLLEQRLPAARASLNHLASHAAEAGALIDGLAEALLQRALTPDDHRLRFRIDALLAEPPLVRTEAIRLAWRSAGWPEQAMTARDWRTIADADKSATLPGGVAVRVEGDFLLLAPQAPAG